MRKQIGILGCGFVGNAVLEYFQDREGVKTVVFDKYKNGGVGCVSDLLTTDMCFVCLPTLYKEETDTYDMGPTHENLSYLSDNNYQGVLLMKSTVLPETSEKLAEQYGLKIVHNPEFLTARTAVEDFREQKHVVLGSTPTLNETDLPQVVEFYQLHFPQAKISTMTSTESESVKIMANSFYAMKVQIFNEYYAFCQHLGINYDTVKAAIVKNGWLNPMHTTVPGPDGQLSYGGACFPKDTKSLLGMMKTRQVPHQVLAATVQEQKEMRPPKSQS